MKERSERIWNYSNEGIINDASIFEFYGFLKAPVRERERRLRLSRYGTARRGEEKKEFVRGILSLQTTPFDSLGCFPPTSTIQTSLPIYPCSTIPTLLFLGLFHLPFQLSSVNHIPYPLSPCDASYTSYRGFPTPFAFPERARLPAGHWRVVGRLGSSAELTDIREFLDLFLFTWQLETNRLVVFSSP